MIERINHIGIAISSMEEWVRLFFELFGFRPVDNPMDSEKTFKSCLLQANEAAIELIQPIGSGGSIHNFLRKRGDAMHHLSFEVDDIYRERQALIENGARLIHSEPLVLGESKTFFIHPHSTGGVLIELVQRML